MNIPTDELDVATESRYGSVVSHNSSSPSSGSDHSSDELEEDFQLHEMEEQISGNIEQVVAFKDLECSDPALWPSVLSDDHRKLFVEKGPCRIKDYEYPIDENGRRFLERHYDRYLAQ